MDLNSLEWVLIDFKLWVGVELGNAFVSNEPGKILVFGGMIKNDIHSVVYEYDFEEQTILNRSPLIQERIY